MCCASAPGYSPAIVATTWRGRSVVSSAHSTTAPRDRSQPSRPARRTISAGSMSGRERSSSRNEPRRFCSTSSRASSTATSVRQATAARCRNSSASSSASPSSSTRPIVSSPEAIGTSPPMLRRHRRGAAAGDGRRRSGAAHRGRPWRPATAPTGPSRGITIATGEPAASAASSATRPSPSPASTESTIFRWTERSRWTRGRARPPGRIRPPGAGGLVGCAHCASS